MTDDPTPYWRIEVPECNCAALDRGWRGRLHVRRCPRILAIALKWGAYQIYYEHTGRKTLPKPPQDLSAAA